MVCYDIKEHGYPWTIEELDALAVIGRMIGQVLIEQNLVYAEAFETKLSQKQASNKVELI